MPTKRTLCEELLAEGMVMTVLDARCDGVVVPPHLVGDPSLRLNLSWRFETPMELTDWGVRATLSFGGHPFDCALPWPAIYVLFSHTSGKPYVFPDDVPAEAVAAAAEAPATATRPSLRLVADDSGTGEAVEPPTDSAKPDPPTPPRPGHLRVVK